MTDRSPDEFAGQPWRDLAPEALGPAGNVPTMLARDEQLLYLWLTARWARGAGAIVDLGCFLGGSTARLAEGARLAGLASAIHAFDRFGGKPGMKAKLGLGDDLPPVENGDSLPLARALLAPWAGQVTLHKGDIDARAPWSEGAIEILVMDASKTAASADRQAAAFFPGLRPGRSVLVQQDYLHWRQPWLPVQMQRLSRWFTPVAHARADTMVFLCTDAITPEALAAGQVAGRSDNEYLDTLRAARPSFRRFGIAPRLQQAIRAVRANPGVRAAFRRHRPGA